MIEDLRSGPPVPTTRFTHVTCSSVIRSGASATRALSPCRATKMGGLLARPPGSPVRTVTFVLANTILGAGMLGLPSAFANCGMVAGFFMSPSSPSRRRCRSPLSSAPTVLVALQFKKMCEAVRPGSVVLTGRRDQVLRSHVVPHRRRRQHGAGMSGKLRRALHTRNFWVLISIAIAGRSRSCSGSGASATATFY